jgi:hypothetical protein
LLEVEVVVITAVVVAELEDIELPNVDHLH